MLQLRTYKYQNTYVQTCYYGGGSERLRCGHSNNGRLQNHNYYFRSPNYILNADLPLHMNSIQFERRYFFYDEDSDIDVTESIQDTLLNEFNNADNTKCLFITGYLGGNTLENKTYDYTFIDKDIWKEYKDDSIISLFNKCVEQTSLRESERQNRTIKQHIRVFKSKVKHIILMLTDYADTDQESETFLALGLVPVIFEDWKEKFAPEEIDYFKCLVNRSQVKRISNVKPTELFRKLETLEKYISLERDIRYQTLFKDIAEARIRTVERKVRDYNQAAEQALSNYDAALKKLDEFNILINKYQEGTDAVVEELKTISKMKGIYDLNKRGSELLKIILRVPLDYFDADEAECAIRNVSDDNVKRFITEIFIEQKYKLIIRADAYYAYTSDASFQDFSSIPEPDCIEINAMFNPHFQFYHCLGDYKPQLIKAMREQDLTLFVNIALAAARSMNFKDGAVCNRWFGWLHNVFNDGYYLNMKCLEKDGQLYTLGQWLNNTFNEEPETINTIEPRDIE